MRGLHISKALSAGVVVVAGLSSSAWADQFQVASVGTVANTNNYPTAENPGVTRDGVATTKYLNFKKLNTGVIESPGASIVTGVKFSTANDAAERDPLTYSIYGSNTVTTTGAELPGATFNDTDFTPILLNADTGLSGVATRSTAGPLQAITNTTSYSTYMVLFPTVRTPGTANSMQVGDIILSGAGGNITLAATPIIGGALVPEPTSAGLLVGIGGLLATRRRHRAC